MQKNGRKKGKKMTVVPEEPLQISLLRDAFAHGAKLNLPSEKDVKGSIHAV